MCLGAIYWARPTKLYFAATREDAAKANFDDSMIYEECCSPVEKRKIPTEHVKLDNASDVFQEWIENEMKIPY